MTAAPASSRPITPRQAVVSLTDAQVKALPTTPRTIIAAPGAGKAIVPVFATARLAWVADYTNINAAAVLQLDYDGGDLAAVALDNAVDASVAVLLASGESTSAIFSLPARVSGSAVRAEAGFADGDVANLPVTLEATNAAAGDFTGGNAANVLRVSVSYYVLTLADGALG